MSLHKLTAGDGYTYLVRQVAAADSTERARSALSDYYSAKGESPGRWFGKGLASLSRTGARDVSPQVVDELWTVAEGSAVSEAQMRALFGEGLHPNADEITKYLIARGVHGLATTEATRLGRQFHISDGETGFQRALAIAYREHNNAAGKAWNAPIDAPTRAAIRTAVAREQFTDTYGRAPADDRELSGFIAREIRARTTSVAGYDLTFSPVKSVSALWAIAPPAVSKAIEEAHDAAVADVLKFLESAAAFTRSGTNGVAQVDTTGLIAAAFTHRDSRAGDPDLHTHVAVSNKVSTIDTNGVHRWLALDGQPLHRATVAASELYNTRLEAHLGQRLGVRFAEAAPEGRGKRPVREIVGIPTELLDRWSSRRAAIEARTAELSKEFQCQHGREPTNVEAIALAQQATLESREAKHEPRSLAEQRQTWRAEAVEVLGGHRKLTAMIGEVLSGRRRSVEPATPQWVAGQAAKAIAVVSKSRSGWQRHHVLAEAQRIVRASGHAGDPSLAERITNAALAEPLSVPHARVGDDEFGEPPMLRRRDGSGVYTRHGTALYTSTETLAAERRILAAAHRGGGRRTTNDDVELALAESAARGKKLNPGQAALVTEMATGGSRLALALAPAGTGKTTAMTALSHAWRSSGGQVIGLAPTAAAANELATDLDAPTDTVAKLVQLASGELSGSTPKWFTRIDASTLVIVDEAGKAGTLDLDSVIGHALAKGASVRLVGDDGQLASISAGGVLRDIASETDALTLSELVRFTSAAEGAASLALRAGDPAGIGYYIDHHRVHVGADETAAEMAYTAWRADLDAGRDSLLLAPTNDVVDALNARARLDRLTAAGGHILDGREAILADQLAASAGDVVRTRRNARWLRLGRADFVRNGYRFTIVEVLDDGGLRVRHLGTGRQLHLPADYVAEHVTLGYAATIDSAQGLTAKFACHVVGAAHLTRQLLYVALTRGRVENHIYLSTAEADPHRVLTPKATHPDTAVDVLSKALARDGSQVSATSADRDARDPFTRLAAAADMFHDALGVAAEHHLGARRLAELADLAESRAPGLTDANGWPVLRKHLALIAAAGSDPATVLADAINQGPLHDADDPAAVLDWRIDPTGGHSTRIGPLRWLPATPAQLANDPLWGAYLSRRADLVGELADQIRAQVRSWTTGTAPAWAKPVLAADPVLAAEIAVFRAAHGVAPEDTRLLGAEQYANRARAIQLLLEQHATAAIGRRTPDASRFNQLIDSIDARIRADGYWTQLGARLAHAARSRPDLGDLVKQAAAEGPLPDELPAAALWWRLSAELAPTATLDTTHGRLRPAWTADLHAVFGSAIAEAITADPAWPGLVAAIAAADPTRWTPGELLHLAAEHLADAQPDHDISPYDYARLITYTVEAYTSDHLHPDDKGPVSDNPPLSPEEEEELPPDPQHSLDSGADEIPAMPDVAPLDPKPEYLLYPSRHEYGGDLGELHFEDLSTTPPARELKPALGNVHWLRDKYQHAAGDIAALEQQIRDNNGPAMRAAMPELRELRDRADADRPYLIAVSHVLDQWSDAEEQYDQAMRNVQWARHQLAGLEADPAADPLDVASARADVNLRMMLLPNTTPAEQFYPALSEAMAARAEAAGGPDKIITGADVETVRARAFQQDLAALETARYERHRLRADLDRAETAAAAAFAAAETSSAEHVTVQLDALDTELRVLQVAGTFTPERQLSLPDTALVGLADLDAAALRALARLPFAVTPVRAVDSRERTAALHTLHAAANAAERKVLWCSPTQDQANQARTNDLADTAVTVAHAHQRLSDGAWRLPAGSLLIVDGAAAVAPHAIADLAEHAAATRSGLILLDTQAPQWPRQPSAALLRLLDTELRWTITLGPNPLPPRTPHPAPPDLDPVLTQTGRLAADLLGERLRTAVARRDQIRTANHAAYDRYLTATWIRTHSHDTGLDRGHDPSPGSDLPGM
ncbi:MobF family relaxase [Mycobacterium kansasii]